jgi:hypothetical protein
MVLRATNDGDFQGADISYGSLRLEMRIPRNDGQGYTRKVRELDLRQFPSIADCIVSEDEIEYGEEF